MACSTNHERYYADDARIWTLNLWHSIKRLYNFIINARVYIYNTLLYSCVIYTFIFPRLHIYAIIIFRLKSFEAQ